MWLVRSYRFVVLSRLCLLCAYVCACDWSALFAACLLQLWSATHSAPLVTFSDHQHTVYGVRWNPHNPHVAASVSGDCSVKILDCSSEWGALNCDCCMMLLTEMCSLVCVQSGKALSPLQHILAKF